LEKKRKNSSSKYFGVTKKNTNGHIYWHAYVTANRKQHYIGNFKTELEAAQAYNSYVKANNLPNPLNQI
jgi:hypothetical protein